MNVRSYFHNMQQVVKFRPSDKDAKTKCTECKKIVQRLAFERAIAVEEKKKIAERIDLNSIGECHPLPLTIESYFLKSVKVGA